MKPEPTSTDDLNPYRGIGRPEPRTGPRHRGPDPTFADLARGRSGNPRHRATTTH